MSTARFELDDVLRHPVRLQVCAFLSGCIEAEFGRLREYLDLTAPTLSKHLSSLESAGYVRVRKGYVGKRPRTWLALTPSGRSAVERHVETLRMMAETARAASAKEQGGLS